MDLVDGLKAFVATAQSGSFTEAANRLGISNRLTSKYVAELESRLGARLLQRTTRKVGLTPAGQELLQRAPSLLNELDDLLGTLNNESQGLSGLIRVSAPVTFGEIYIKDLVSRFIAMHPDVDIDLRLDDAYVDLAAEGIDLAFRVGTPAVSSLKVRKLGDFRSSLVASPDYLARKGTPRTPEELADHTCIVDTNRREATRWAFRKDGKEVVFSAQRHLMVNSARVVRDWAVEGFGIAFGPDFVLADDIAASRLVPLLTQYEKPAHPLNAVYLAGNILPRKVRTLIDFAVETTRASGLF